ncbi:MAG: oligosaccharide flippase family protein [Chitinophagales bacterium]|nr:polysaccharide biosynthesis protein [Bacteroidota bacterium]MCB9043110.1 polysaccharide biosynthesis protein [Chitinophagales bacterium]
MGRVIIKQGIYSSLAVYTGIALGYIIYLYLFPLLLSKEQIGLIQIIEEASMIFYVLAAGGIPATIVRFAPFFRKNENRNEQGLLFYTLTLPVLGILVVSLLFYFAYPTILRWYARAPELQQYLYCIPLVGIGMTYFYTLYAYLTTHLQVIAPTLAQEFLRRIFIILLIVGWSIGWWQMKGLLHGWILMYYLMAFSLVIYTMYVGYWDVRFQKPDFSKEFIQKIGKFAAYMALGGLGSILIPKIDTLMVGSLKGLGDTGIYAIAAKMAMVVDVPRATLSKIVNPLVAQAFQKDDMDEIEKLYQKSALNQLLIGSFIFILIWVNLHFIFHIMPNGANFALGGSVVFYLGMAKIIDNATGVNYEILLNSKHYRFSLLLMVLMAAFTIVSNWFLIQYWGFSGAAMATLITFALFNLIRLIFIWRKMNLHPFSKAFFQAVGLVLVTFLLGFLLKNFVIPAQSFSITLLQMAFCSIVVAAFYVGILFKTHISPDINDIIERVFYRVFPKK